MKFPWTKPATDGDQPTDPKAKVSSADFAAFQTAIETILTEQDARLTAQATQLATLDAENKALLALASKLDSRTIDNVMQPQHDAVCALAALRGETDRRVRDEAESRARNERSARTAAQLKEEGKAAAGAA